MARPFAKAFYESPAWKRTRKAYAATQHGLCERCRAHGVVQAGEIVHHKIHLTPANICDPNITLSYQNLELLCFDCHNKEHNSKPSIRDGFSFDADGNIVPLCADEN